MAAVKVLDITMDWIQPQVELNLPTWETYMPLKLKQIKKNRFQNGIGYSVYSVSPVQASIPPIILRTL
jgi:hypothetical protein